MTLSPQYSSGTRLEPDDPIKPQAAASQNPEGQSCGRRVCLITTEFHGLFRNGGIGTANTGLALSLAEAGFDVTVAFADADESGPRVKVGNFSELQKKYCQLGIALDFVPANPAVPKAFDDCRSASYCVYLYLKQHNFDVVYFNDCGGHGYYSLLAKRVGVFNNAPRMYVVAHGPQEWVLDINSIFWERPTIITAYLEQRSVELADALISPSQYMADWMRSHGWTMPAKVLVIQNIVRLPDSATAVASDLNPAPVTEIVFFGRLEVRKGLELFCDAIDLLNQAVDLSGIKITFMGKFMYIAGLHSGIFTIERARRWRSSMRILAKYGQEEALSYLNRPGVVAVIPSYTENSPCVVSECLQMGLPFLATGSGGTVELVAPEDRELCLFPIDPQALAAKLGLVLKSGHCPARLAASQADVRAQWMDLTGQGPGISAELAESLSPASNADAQLQAPRSMPLVSICIAQSSAPTVAEALIDSLLRQTYPNLEFVLFDDILGPSSTARASLDSNPERIRLRLLPGRPADRGAARNAAAAQAQGDYLLFVEEDNVLLTPDCVGALVTAALRTGANIASSVGLRFQQLGRRVDPRNGELSYLPVGACAELGGFENCFGDGVFLIDRAGFDRVGGFQTPCDPGIEEWLFLATSVLSGLRLEVVPEPLFLRGSRRRPGLARSTVVDNLRRILDAYRGQNIQIFRRAIEATVRLNGPQSEVLYIAPEGVSSEAQEIAERVSSSFEPNSEDAFRSVLQYFLERQNVAEALDFALYNGRSLLYEAVGAVKQAAETAALDTIRQNALDMWHEVALTGDVRQRVFSVSVFPAEELERPLGVVASHAIDVGVRILKAAAVCPPGTRSVRAVAKVEAADPASTSLALAVSAPNAHLHLSNRILESSDPFWWSGWVSPASEDGTIELTVALSEPAGTLLDLHFLCKTSADEVREMGRVTWESVTATLLARGAVTPSNIESIETGTPLSRELLDRGALLTEHSDFPFPVFVPGDQTLLHPLPGRAALVRVDGAIPPGATGVRSVVSLQRDEAHPVQFAVCIRPASAPVTDEAQLAAADTFSGWFPVTDKFRHHGFTLKLKQPASQKMDLYLATRVADYPDVYFCHAVWHHLLILGEAPESTH